MQDPKTIPSKVSAPAGGKGSTVPHNPVGKAPGTAVPGFTSVGIKPGKIAC